MKHFKFYSKSDILSLTKVRKFETRVGERLQFLDTSMDWPEVINKAAAKYVIIGIPEDIGVKANHGIGGADTNWLPFLNAFLNTQSNDFFTGEDCLLLGHFDFGDLKYLIENNAYNQEELIVAYRHAVNIIDEEVENILKVVATSNKVPIIIGGGHNNAYPVIKGVAKGLHKSGAIPLAQINCINLDSHADYKTMEGRHSGNAFRYAESDGYLGKYGIIALHESYIQQTVLMDIHENPFIKYSTFEDIFIHERMNITQAIAGAVEFTDDNYTGIEMDVDAIANVLSSACSPSGLTTLQARQYMNFAGQHAKVAYLNISEGACQLGDGNKDETTGKLISYLVTDFIKANSLKK